MIEFLARNQDNLIVGFIFMIAGAALGPLFAALRREPGEGGGGLTLPVVIDNSTNIVNNTYNSQSRGADDPLPIFYVFTAVACVAYIWWREEVLIAFTSAAFFLIVFFCSAAAYAHISGLIAGRWWAAYLIFIMCIVFFSFMLILSALKPEHAPPNFQYVQYIVRRYGFLELHRYFSIEDVMWLITHVFGVFLLLYMLVRAAASLTHYAALVHLAGSPSHGGFAYWLVRVTQRHKDLVKNFLVITLVGTAAYFLINGYVFLWMMRLG